MTVGENTIDIQDIVLSGSDGFGSEVFSLWEGAPSAVEGSGYAYWLESDGFYWEDDAMGTEFSLEPGQGFVLETSNEGIGVNFAGEVSDKDANLDLVNGYNFFGNPFAEPISIQNIVVNGSEGFGMEIFSRWEGAPSAIEGSGYAYWQEPDGFYWEDDAMGTEYWIQPGEGFVIECGNSDGLSITIKSPYKL